MSPNLISLVALVFGLGAAIAAARAEWGLGLALWLANRVTDGLDGTVARVAERQSDFGGYLDILLDFVVYAAIPVGSGNPIGRSGRSDLGSGTGGRVLRQRLQLDVSLSRIGEACIRCPRPRAN